MMESALEQKKPQPDGTHLSSKFNTAYKHLKYFLPSIIVSYTLILNNQSPPPPKDKEMKNLMLNHILYPSPRH